MSSLATTPCPACNLAGGLRINVRLFAKPIGEFSIAGSQMKAIAEARPVLACANCDWEQGGSFDPDGRHVSFPRREED